MTESILIPAGQRQGRTFDNEGEFINALDAGKQVFTLRNGIYFEVTTAEGGVRYVALTAKPDGI